MKPVLAALAVLAFSATGRAEQPPPEIEAPELEGGLAWLNTDKPLKLSELRGQVVVLDFWTYCCINCMHVLPLLHKLEEEHKNDPVVVIGVHSAKFVSEKDPDRIREAMLRYDVKHPVYVDQNMTVWDRYGINSWPTLVIIRPNGKIAAEAPGEPDQEVLDSFVNQVLDEARADGSLAKSKYVIHAPPEADTGPLSFPGKVIAAKDGRIFVSDSGHHRVLILNHDGRVLDTIGSGFKGSREGDFAEAAFDDPEGLALDGDQLYIADTRGYVIERADLKARKVTRLAGTGMLGAGPLGESAPAAQTGLRSPWALLLDGRRLFFSAAGSHQIGVVYLESGTVARFAGSGRENIKDGPPTTSNFAQPSGLTLQGNTLYSADSETSSVRAIDESTREAKTVMGTGLFDFGDSDGPVKTARLQHPLGIAWTNAGLVVADTYNNKVKVFSKDLSSITTVPLEVAGKKLFEPGGLGVEPDGSLLIADTDNHRLVRVPIHDGQLRPREASVITVTGAPSVTNGVALSSSRGTSSSPSAVPSQELPPAAIGAGKHTLTLILTAPTNYELNNQAPYEVKWTVSRGGDRVHLESDTVKGHQAGPPDLRVQIPMMVGAGAGSTAELQASVRAVVCDARTHAACYPLHNQMVLPLKLGEGSDAAVAAVLTAPDKRH
jgi:thiol-disulfide isomerase/thioredoxin